MIDLHYHEGVAHIAINDGKANAVGFNFLEAMNGALDEIDGNKDATAIVISGKPGMFSAGFDLKVMMAEPARAGELVQGGGLMLMRLFTHKLPVVGAITGHAMAAGAFLALACDTRIGTAGDFKIGLNETAIGMVLPVFGLEMAKCRLNNHRLTEAFIQAKLYGPDEAVEVGYLDKVLPADEVIEAAIAEATALGALPNASYYGNKMLLRQPFVDVVMPSLEDASKVLG